MKAAKQNGGSYAALATTWHQNPKVMRLVAKKQFRALFVYTCGLTYACAHMTDGVLEGPVLPLLHGTRQDAAQLVDAGLWKPDPEFDGWLIHDFGKYQMTAEELAVMRKERSDAGKASGARRREKKAAREDQDRRR